MYCRCLTAPDMEISSLCQLTCSLYWIGCLAVMSTLKSVSTICIYEMLTVKLTVVCSVLRADIVVWRIQITHQLV